MGKRVARRDRLDGSLYIRLSQDERARLERTREVIERQFGGRVSLSEAARRLLLAGMDDMRVA